MNLATQEEQTALTTDLVKAVIKSMKATVEVVDGQVFSLTDRTTKLTLSTWLRKYQRKLKARQLQDHIEANRGTWSEIDDITDCWLHKPLPRKRKLSGAKSIDGVSKSKREVVADKNPAIRNEVTLLLKSAFAKEDKDRLQKKYDEVVLKNVELSSKFDDTDRRFVDDYFIDEKMGVLKTFIETGFQTDIEYIRTASSEERKKVITSLLEADMQIVIDLTKRPYFVLLFDFEDMEYGFRSNAKKFFVEAIADLKNASAKTLAEWETFNSLQIEMAQNMMHMLHFQHRLHTFA